MTKPTHKPKGRPRKYPADMPKQRPPRHIHSISLTPEDEHRLQTLIRLKNTSVNETIAQLIRDAFGEL